MQRWGAARGVSPDKPGEGLGQQESPCLLSGGKGRGGDRGEGCTPARRKKTPRSQMKGKLQTQEGPHFCPRGGPCPLPAQPQLESGAFLMQPLGLRRGLEKC